MAQLFVPLKNLAAAGRRAVHHRRGSPLASPASRRHLNLSPAGGPRAVGLYAQPVKRAKNVRWQEGVPVRVKPTTSNLRPLERLSKRQLREGDGGDPVTSALLQWDHQWRLYLAKYYTEDMVLLTHCTPDHPTSLTSSNGSLASNASQTGNQPSQAGGLAGSTSSFTTPAGAGVVVNKHYTYSSAASYSSTASYSASRSEGDLVVLNSEIEGIRRLLDLYSQEANGCLTLEPEEESGGATPSGLSTSETNVWRLARRERVHQNVLRTLVDLMLGWTAVERWRWNHTDHKALTVKLNNGIVLELPGVPVSLSNQEAINQKQELFLDFVDRIEAFQRKYKSVGDGVKRLRKKVIRGWKTSGNVSLVTYDGDATPHPNLLKETCVI
ncbi:hypothetical protein GNI_156850 [Gregarina niphandrodes]|uniref:Uncharacterized protein n=1 Tax=Gregarina niphandrodes TaxID=110365 RepID=A0A023B008_GRENI|nr:hypothetical protein GNI_156850 [Gregarina niphandrodes]EZG43879.1 hypothetical protein GNI_156850 [Gregarina niphandrodes]|eukprot:XP_011132942.1 hypothetical protein GNI_156850 [Gregarina niphandrodes]